MHRRSSSRSGTHKGAFVPPNINACRIANGSRSRSPNHGSSPSAATPAPGCPRYLHRKGLKKVLRKDTHDRPDTWFVLPDGSNLEQCLEDVLRAMREEGLPWFEQIRSERREPGTLPERG